MSAPDFRAALAKIPPKVPYKHHGRDPKEGLDCVGLVLALYKLAGLDISHLDLPYGAKDSMRPHRNRLILAQLMRDFRLVGQINGDISWPVNVPHDAVDGDVLLIGSVGHENHLAVVVAGAAVQMAGVVGMVNGVRQVVDGRLRTTSLQRSWAFVSSVFRLGILCDPKRVAERRQKA